MKKAMMIFPVISGILWGSAGVFVRELTAFGFNNITVMFTRMSMAATILFLGLLIYDKSLLKIRLKDLWVFLGCGLLGMLGLNACYNEAMNRLTLSLAAVLLSTSPIFVMFLATIIFKEKITKRKILCMAAAFIGCVLASGIVGAKTLTVSASGILLGIGAAFFYAMYSIFSRISTGKGYNTFTVIFYSVLLISIVLAPFTSWGDTANFVTAAPFRNSIFLLLHAICTSVLPYILYTLAITRIETGKAAILAAGGEPIAAVVFGLLFFSEVPTIITLVGLAVTITALYFLCKPETK